MPLSSSPDFLLNVATALRITRGAEHGPGWGARGNHMGACRGKGEAEAENEQHPLLPPL